MYIVFVIDLWFLLLLRGILNTAGHIVFHLFIYRCLVIYLWFAPAAWHAEYRKMKYKSGEDTKTICY